MFYFYLLVTFAALLKESEVVVQKLKDFRIAFSGLKIGHHNFKLSAGKTFFEEFEALSAHGGDVIVNIDMEKQERMLIFNFEIKGYVDLTCDRCLEVYSQTVDATNTLYVRLQNGVYEQTEESEDVIIISDQESDLDVSHFVYEFISLALPIQKAHGVDADGNSLCNEEMMDKLEIDHHPDIKAKNDDQTDPRWDALKKLKEKK